MTRRPTIALAMMDGMLGYAFRTRHLEALAEVGELLSTDAVSDFSTPEAAALLAEAEVLVGHWGCPTLTAEVLAAAPRLEMFAYAAGTVKWQVVDAVWERDLLVTSAAAANAVPVAEFAAAAIVLANKGLPWYAAKERDPDLTVPLDPTRLGNVGRRVGLVGASHVGRLTVELLAPHDLEVAIADPYLDAATADRLGVQRMELDELCGWCDVLSLHAPDIESTKGMVGAAQLARLGDGATVVNTARGALIDHDALLAELRSGRLSAILDVTEPEPLPADSLLRTLPNVILTPHIAGAMGEEVVRLADLVVEEVRRFAAGEPPLYPVHQADLDRIA
jgi:phosphoglycerate dehydrogenase-like enzyme